MTSGATPDWHDVIALSDFEDRDMVPVKILDKRLIIYKTDTQTFATDRRCTHQSADLMRGYFDGIVIECPVHQGRFDVRSGAALSPPVCEALKTYEVKIVGNRVFVKLD